MDIVYDKGLSDYDCIALFSGLKERKNFVPGVWIDLVADNWVGLN